MLRLKSLFLSLACTLVRGGPLYKFSLAGVKSNILTVLVTVDLMQSEPVLWKLKIFVKGALEVQGKSSAVVNVDSNHDRSYNNNGGNNNNSNKKRKKEICNAIAKTAKKRSLKPSS